MLKAVLSFVAAGAVFASANPAAAQYYPARPVPAPGYGYEGGYGYSQGYGFRQVRDLQERIDNIRRQISRLDRRDVIRGRSADRLLSDADRIEHRLHESVRRGGLDPRSAGEIQYRLQRLEQRVQYAVNSPYERRYDRW